jgi:hypothetical protein
MAGDRTVELVALEMLGPRVNFVAVWVFAGEAARCALPARALIRTEPGSPVLGLGLRGVLGIHGIWLC